MDTLIVLRDMVSVNITMTFASTNETFQNLCFVELEKFNTVPLTNSIKLIQRRLRFI